MRMPLERVLPYLLIVALCGCSSPNSTAPKATPPKTSPPPPCHPGCFPAGTAVETPSGPRPIEILRPGDEVLTVSDAGRTEPTTIASVFAGHSPLVEVTTATGVLVTTAKQPLSLTNGDSKTAGDLTAGDELVRWQDGSRTATQVLGITSRDTMAPIFNLVLQPRGTFIANGYLVTSKPPPEE